MKKHRRSLVMMLFLAAAPVAAAAQTAAALREVCPNEISLFCEGENGSALRGCLLEHRKSLMSPCRNFLDEAARAAEAKQTESAGPATALPPAVPAAAPAEGTLPATGTAPVASPAPAAVTFEGVKYYYRRDNTDGQREFTPQGEEDVDLWSNMLSITRRPEVTDGESLAAFANSLLENYKQYGAMILDTDSRPRTDEKEAEHLIAAVWGRKTFLEAVFIRLLMHNGVGYIVIYSHREHGERVGDRVSPWLEANGPVMSKAIMAWDLGAALESRANAGHSAAKADTAPPAGAGGFPGKVLAGKLWPWGATGGIVILGLSALAWARFRKRPGNNAGQSQPEVAQDPGSQDQQPPVEIKKRWKYLKALAAVAVVAAIAVSLWARYGFGPGEPGLTFANSGNSGSAALVYTPEVRKMSFADEKLFTNLVMGIGGVTFADEVHYPDAKRRKLVRIEAAVPYNGREAGVERWEIEHDGGETVSYTVTYTPDGRGGTVFSVAK